MFIEKSDGGLSLGGGLRELGLENLVKILSGWQWVSAPAFQGRLGLLGFLGRPIEYLMTLFPLPNHIYAFLNKMFEYVSAGSPVIDSDFPPWRRIIQRNRCGLLLSPLRTASIALAVDYLAAYPEEAHRIGANG